MNGGLFGGGFEAQDRHLKVPELEIRGSPGNMSTSSFFSIRSCPGGALSGARVRLLILTHHDDHISHLQTLQNLQRLRLFIYDEWKCFH